MTIRHLALALVYAMALNILGTTVTLNITVVWLVLIALQWFFED